MDTLFKNIPLTMLVLALVLAGAIFVGGMLFSILSNVLTMFVFRNAPSSKAMNEWQARQFSAALAPPQRKGPSLQEQMANPMRLAAWAMGALLVLGVMVYVVVPTKRDCELRQNRFHPECRAITERMTGTLVVTSDQRGAAQMVSQLPAGNPNAGKVLFDTKGCSGCHSFDAAKVTAGPSLYGAYTRAATRRGTENYTADQYLYESLVNPGAFVVNGFAAGVMPANFSEQLTKPELAHLLAWIKASGSQP